MVNRIFFCFIFAGDFFTHGKKKPFVNSFSIDFQSIATTGKHQLFIERSGIKNRFFKITIKKCLRYGISVRSDNFYIYQPVFEHGIYF
ncbi:hypothetical protein D3C86_1528410 [compost metagenome]